MTTKPNSLAQETSPYLQQHAYNPVDWYPWGKQALEKAQRENKPILLSIGYAACHWCHVMAHESFVDEPTAKLMNQLFVNIKVDREERPDLDKIYQTAHTLLTQSSGGWPLTIFLTPGDLIPFFSGTYFPREAHYQLPAFKDVLQGVGNLYRNRFDDIKKQNADLLDILQHQATFMPAGKLTDEPLQLAHQLLQQSYDSINGGFNGAPKFPQAPLLEFLLHHHASSMAENTLKHMARGGIYDQLAGGFFRYTVDANWQIPHFEKMLYDNAQLLYLYATASTVYSQAYFAKIAQATAAWVLSDMHAAEEGFYASMDADSEGHEGKCYIWDRKELETLLQAEEFAVMELHFGLDQPPNFENHWHLHIERPLTMVANLLQIDLSTAQACIASASAKMLAARNNRVLPRRDKKMLTAWNALMIKGLLVAGEQLNEAAFVSAAQQALTFLQEKLWVNQHLLACYSKNKAHLNAYLDDYAFLIDALLTSLQVAWNTNHFLFAIELVETLLKHFSDPASGGFFFTADNHEKLLYRPKTMMDEAIPSGNSIATRSLLTLGYLLGETRYLEVAEKTLKAAWPALLKHPVEHGSLLLALKQYLTPAPIIILRGEVNEMKKWQAACKNSHNIVLAIPADAENLPAALAAKKFSGNTCAYICQGTQCSAAIQDLAILKARLAKQQP